MTSLFSFGSNNASTDSNIGRRLQRKSGPVPQRFQRYKHDINPIAQEPTVTTIEPTPARKVELLRKYYEEKICDLGTPTSYRKWCEAKWIERNPGRAIPGSFPVDYNNEWRAKEKAKITAYEKIITQLNNEGASDAVLDAYLRGFHNFLRGRPTKEHAAKLERLGIAGKFEPFRDPSVQAYLRAFSKVKKDFYEDLALLRMRGPIGDIRNLELYYKYILDGNDDDKLEKNIWVWLEGGRLPHDGERLIGSEHTDMVRQLYREFPVGTEKPDDEGQRQEDQGEDADQGDTEPAVFVPAAAPGAVAPPVGMVFAPIAPGPLPTLVAPDDVDGQIAAFQAAAATAADPDNHQDAAQALQNRVTVETRADSAISAIQRQVDQAPPDDRADYQKQITAVERTEQQAVADQQVNNPGSVPLTVSNDPDVMEPGDDDADQATTTSSSGVGAELEVPTPPTASPPPRETNPEPARTEPEPTAAKPEAGATRGTSREKELRGELDSLQQTGAEKDKKIDELEDTINKGKLFVEKGLQHVQTVEAEREEAKSDREHLSNNLSAMKRQNEDLLQAFNDKEFQYNDLMKSHGRLTKQHTQVQTELERNRAEYEQNQAIAEENQKKLAQKWQEFLVTQKAGSQESTDAALSALDEHHKNAALKMKDEHQRALVDLKATAETEYRKRHAEWESAKNAELEKIMGEAREGFRQREEMITKLNADKEAEVQRRIAGTQEKYERQIALLQANQATEISANLEARDRQYMAAAQEVEAAYNTRLAELEKRAVKAEEKLGRRTVEMERAAREGNENLAQTVEKMLEAQRQSAGYQNVLRNAQAQNVEMKHIERELREELGRVHRRVREGEAREAERQIWIDEVTADIRELDLQIAQDAAHTQGVELQLESAKNQIAFVTAEKRRLQRRGEQDVAVLQANAEVLQKQVESAEKAARKATNESHRRAKEADLAERLAELAAARADLAEEREIQAILERGAEGISNIITAGAQAATGVGAAALAQGRAGFNQMIQGVSSGISSSARSITHRIFDNLAQLQRVESVEPQITQAANVTEEANFGAEVINQAYNAEPAPQQSHAPVQDHAVTSSTSTSAAEPARQKNKRKVDEQDNSKYNKQFAEVGLRAGGVPVEGVRSTLAPELPVGQGNAANAYEGRDVGEGLGTNPNPAGNNGEDMLVIDRAEQLRVSEQEKAEHQRNVAMDKLLDADLVGNTIRARLQGFYTRGYGDIGAVSEKDLERLREQVPEGDSWEEIKRAPKRQKGKEKLGDEEEPLSPPPNRGERASARRRGRATETPATIDSAKSEEEAQQLLAARAQEELRDGIKSIARSLARAEELEGNNSAAVSSIESDMAEVVLLQQLLDAGNLSYADTSRIRKLLAELLQKLP